MKTDTGKVGKKIMSWDTSEITDGELEYIKTELLPQEDADHWAYGLSDDKIRDKIYDSDVYSIAWDDLLEYLHEKLEEMFPEGFYEARVKNFGWRSTSGSQVFQLKSNDAQEFLRKILPNTDCTFYIYEYKAGTRKGLAINNFHHDSPTGAEWYYILPLTADEYEKEMYG